MLLLNVKYTRKFQVSSGTVAGELQRPRSCYRTLPRSKLRCVTKRVCTRRLQMVSFGRPMRRKRSLAAAKMSRHCRQKTAAVVKPHKRFSVLSHALDIKFCCTFFFYVLVSFNNACYVAVLYANRGELVNERKKFKRFFFSFTCSYFKPSGVWIIR